MPEVVYPTPNEKGEERKWDDVFPIWNIDGNEEWQIINQILYEIAMNNRFGSQTREQQRESMLSFATKSCEQSLSEVMDDVERRNVIFTNYGKTTFYVNQVFANLGGAYRQYK